MGGEAIFSALVHDVKAAIRWVRANAVTWGGSLRRWAGGEGQAIEG
jgi:acetyl esterase/lipase